MSYRFDTLAIHAGQPNDQATGAVTVPIYQTSTFEQLEPGISRGYDYSRTAHPTRRALEENLAALEGAHFGLAFSTGMAAIHNVLSILRSRCHHPRSLRRCVAHFHEILRQVRHRFFFRRYDRSPLDRPSDSPGDPTALAGNAVQSAAQGNRYRRMRCHRATKRNSYRRRQHVRHACLATADRPRRRHRRALNHQIHQRP